MKKGIKTEKEIFDQEFSQFRWSTHISPLANEGPLVMLVRSSKFLLLVVTNGGTSLFNGDNYDNCIL
jgi:hypothetical protein